MAKTKSHAKPHATTHRHEPPHGAVAEDRSPEIPGETIRVRATMLGFHDNTRRRVGDVFTLRPRTVLMEEDGRITKDGEPTVQTAEQQFSERWMEKVDADTPERAMSPDEAAKRESARLNGVRMPNTQYVESPDGANDPDGDEPTGAKDVLK